MILPATAMLNDGLCGQCALRAKVAMNIPKWLFAGLPLVVFGGIWIYGGIIFPGDQLVMTLMILLGCAYLIIGLFANPESRWWRMSKRIALYSLLVSIPIGNILLFVIVRFGGYIDKNELIQVALGTPLPNGMQNLVGAGGTWQGFNGYFRFKLDSKEMQRYLNANRCTRIPLEDGARRFNIPHSYEKFFSPKWNPDLNTNKQCYIRYISDYTTWILTDQNSDWVYVFTIGSHSHGPPHKNQDVEPDTPAQQPGPSPSDEKP